MITPDRLTAAQASPYDSAEDAQFLLRALEQIEDLAEQIEPLEVDEDGEPVEPGRTSDRATEEILRLVRQARVDQDMRRLRRQEAAKAAGEPREVTHAAA